MKHFSFGPGPAGVIGGHSHGEGPFTTGCPFCGQLRGRKEGRVVREKTGTSYTTRYCGTTSAGRLRTDSAWNLSLRENAMDIALTSNPKQRDYLRRLRRSTISRYRSGSRRLRKYSNRRRLFTIIINQRRGGWSFSAEIGIG